MNKYNILIAEFMGYKPGWYDHGINGIKRIYINDAISKGYYKSPEEFDYHRDWNSLMEVVDKIEGLGFPVQIKRHECLIQRPPDEYWIRHALPGQLKLQSVYKAVVEFIEKEDR